MGMYTDEDLQELVRANIKLTQENNRMLKAMRRDVWVGRTFRVLFWLVLLVGSYMVYYVFLAPYIEQMQQIYTQVQGLTGATSSSTTPDTSFRGWAIEEARKFLK
jgi:type II secretory pathway component PulM